MDLDRLLRWSAARRDGKPLLTIPCLDELRNPSCQELVDRQVSDAAKIIAGAGKLHRWRKWNRDPVLVIWSHESRQFIGFDNTLFCRWLGQTFDLVDKAGMSFGQPHAATGSRLWEELLKDTTGLPWASWELTDQWRRQNK
jgi:hypothetical protein